MATLTPTLTLTSSDATSETLNLSVTDSLTVTDPSVGISRITITTADNQELVDEATSGVFISMLKILIQLTFLYFKLQQVYNMLD